MTEEIWTPKHDVVVYSCYFGKNEPLNVDVMGHWGGYDRVVFTDDPNLEHPNAEVVVLPDFGLGAAYMSRRPKLMPHRYFKGNVWSIYIDNRASLKLSPAEMVAKIESEYDDGAPAGRFLFRHPKRSCAYRELRVCRRMGYVTEDEYAHLREVFKQTKFPRNQGLFVNTLMVQKMGSAATDCFNETWYELFLRLSKRDQITLCLAKWGAQMDMPVLPFENTAIIDWPVISDKERLAYRDTSNKT